MNIITNMFGILFLTTVSGSILLCICRLFRTVIDEYGSAGFIYHILRIASLMYLIPIVPILISVVSYLRNRGAYVLFLGNENINIVICIVVFVWLVGFVVKLIMFLKNLYTINKVIKDAYPSDMRVDGIFNVVRANLKLKRRRIGIKIVDNLASPAVAGMFRPTILIPSDIEFNDRQLEIALTHECYHIKYNDNMIKLLTILAMAINWFNPLVKKLVNELDEWHEYHCDSCTCKKMGIFKEYLELILKIIMSKDDNNNMDMSKAAGKKESLIVRRIEHLVKYSEIKKKKILAAVLMILVLVLSTSGIAFASDLAMKSGNIISWETAENYDITEDAYEAAENITVFEEMPDDAVTEVEGEVIDLYTSSTSSFNWQVPVGYRYVTKQYSMTAGDSILLSVVVSPSDKTIRTGLVNPDGSYTYMAIAGSGSYNFPIKTTGNYRIFVTNISDAQVSVTGTFIRTYN